jgi:hypothetical protein
MLVILRPAHGCRRAARGPVRAPLLRQRDTVVYRVKDGGIRVEVRWVTDERANTAQML